MRHIIICFTLALTLHLTTSTSHAAPMPPAQQARSASSGLGVTQQAYINLDGVAIYASILTGMMLTPSVVMIIGNTAVLGMKKTSRATKMGWGITGIIAGALTMAAGASAIASNPTGSVGFGVLFGSLGAASMALGAANVHRARTGLSSRELRGLTRSNQPHAPGHGFAFTTSH